MKRRDFLKFSGAASFSPFILNNTMIQAFMPSNLLNCYDVQDRILVVIQMNGGNDGLNTLVPISQYASYANHRPNIAIPQAQYIELDSTLPEEARVGLHPSMTGIKSLYDSGKVHIVQGAGYPSMNLSHFKSTDLWMTAGDGTPSNFNFNTGWMGRFLDSAFPGVAGNPAGNLLDPLGIQLGNKVPALGFLSNNINPIAINLAGQDPAGYFSVVNEIGGDAPATIPASDYGNRLSHIISVEDSTAIYAGRISNVFNAGSNNISYPGTYLANQLKTVARLISGGCTTKIYLVDLFGFDTHVNQVVNNNTTAGFHANLLSEFSGAVKAFQDDLSSLGLEDKVMTTTFSEFGRKVPENGNLGTDHGTVAPMFIIGSGVDTGMTGVNPDLSTVSGNGTLPGYQHDYRQVYTTLLQDWLGGTDAMLNDAYFSNFSGSKIPFVDPAVVALPTCYLGMTLPQQPLAIELFSFKAYLAGIKTISLEWEANSTDAKDYFEVERSADGIKFAKIRLVEADDGLSNFYTILDEDPFDGDNYYRLKMFNENGEFDYSPIELVNIPIDNSKLSLNIFPNPVSTNFKITFESKAEKTTHLTIVNAKTGPVYSQHLLIKKGKNELAFSVENWASGMYFITLIADDNSFSVSEQLVKI